MYVVVGRGYAYAVVVDQASAIVCHEGDAKHQDQTSDHCQSRGGVADKDAFEEGGHDQYCGDDEEDPKRVRGLFVCVEQI